jgi:hypothetical protein
MLWSASAFAQQHPACAGPQLGTWALLSMETEDQETGQKYNLLGAHPSGYLSYSPDCRMSAILVKESRQVPAASVATDPESIELYRGLMAYAGSYSVDGHQITHHIETSWNQAWTGATQVSQFNIAENTLYIRTGPGKSPMTGRQSSNAAQEYSDRLHAQFSTPMRDHAGGSGAHLRHAAQPRVAPYRKPAMAADVDPLAGL